MLYVTCLVQEVWKNGRITPMILKFLNVLIESIQTYTLGVDGIDHIFVLASKPSEQSIIN